MALHLSLPPELQERLCQEAERRGQPIEAVAMHLLNEHLPPPLDARREAAIALLHRWMEEDAALSPEQQTVNEELFRNLDADRTSNRPLFPPAFKGISW